MCNDGSTDNTEKKAKEKGAIIINHKKNLGYGAALISLFEKARKENQFVINKDGKIQENIVTGKNSTITRDSFVKGPTIIGENCVIGPSARIGPYVSVGDNSKVKNCDIENSILMENTTITSKIHIKDSIIANGSKIEDNKEPKKHQFLLGERSQVKL